MGQSSSKQSNSDHFTSQNEGGGQAAQVEPTVQCPEANSRKSVNSPGDGGFRSRAPSINSERSASAKILSEDDLSSQSDQEEQMPREGQNDTVNIVSQEADARVGNDREKSRLRNIKKMGQVRGLKIATLNMRGRQNSKKEDKWPLVWSIMRKNRIAILAVQETHLTEEILETTRERFPKITIVSNGHSANSEGVAYIINTNIISKLNWTHLSLIEGRASCLRIIDNENKGFDLINIYAPNQPGLAVDFYEELNERIQENELTQPIILGDFNFVEERQDRLPEHDDPQAVRTAFRTLTKRLNLLDGWRMSNMEEREYTFSQTTGSLSRIDRIYIKDCNFKRSFNWEMINSQTISDHNIATVELIKAQLPFVGKGLERMSTTLIENPTFKKKARKILIKTEIEIDKLALEQQDGIQELWAETKERLLELASSEAKNRRAQLNNEKQMLKYKIKDQLEIINKNNNNKERATQKLLKLKKKQAELALNETYKLMRKSQMQYRTLGEKCTKYFFGLNKNSRDNQTITALEQEDGTLTNSTREMGKIATKHHETLQSRPDMTPEREQEIETLLEDTNKTLSEEQKNFLANDIDIVEVEKSLKESNNGSSPGIDGIPYEFYKAFKLPRMTETEREEYENTKPEDRPTDIIKTLTLVFQDIEHRGIMNIKEKEPEKFNFNDGVMTLLYKKKSVTQIQNYRPITLLNTDYKLYTKALSIRMGIIAPSIIHEDQAGFIPKRSLYDHTKNTHITLEYCNLTDTKGCIIALDQEKAYDKIDHDYLWKVMEKNNFPNVFIQRVKNLYNNAGKAVMLNGCLNKQFKVERGVHQGDPLSCLLYNVAIEPLANAIRESTLEGITFEKAPRSLLVNLFADDTLVYLSETDNFQTLNTILDKFCNASTAKFNIEKTEYLPVGGRDFRENVYNTRIVGDNQIPNGLKIIKDGEQMRTLGAWVGNGATITKQWDSIITTQQRICDIWQGNNLSFRGKELILKALIQSRAAFLATVNGLPKDVEKRMTKMYKEFMWKGKRGLMSWNQIIATRKEGGLNIPDLKARAEAIQVMWIKKWLSSDTDRPIWTYGLDAIIANNIAKNPKVDNDSRLSWVLQSWHESEAKDIQITKETRYMLQVARKHNVQINHPKYSNDLKQAWPLWFHSQVTNNYLWNKKNAKHIRQVHGVKTVADLQETQPCDQACNNMIRKLIGLLPIKVNPLNDTPQAVRIQKLDLTPMRIQQNRENELVTLFNPDITATGTPKSAAKIFGKQLTYKRRNTKPPHSLPAIREAPIEQPEETTVNVLARTQNNKTTVTIWYEEGHHLNRNLIFNTKLTLNQATLIGIAWIGYDNKNDILTIQTLSKRIVRFLKEDWHTKERQNWVNDLERKEWRLLLNILRQRTNTTTLVKVSKSGQEMLKCKSIIKQLINEEATEVEIPPTNKNFDIDGACLREITQKIAYRLACDRKATTPGGYFTEINIKKASDAISELNKTETTSEQIWEGLKKACMPRIADFLWKILHGRIRCGSWFSKIPGWEDKQYCSCGAIEEIEHIIFNCPDAKTEGLWTLISELWTSITNKEFIKPNMGMLMGIGAFKVKIDGDYNKYISQLYLELITLAAWSIWRNRNNRVFNKVEQTEDIQVNLWKKEIITLIKVEYDAIELVKFDKRHKSYMKFARKWARNGILAELGPGQNTRELNILLEI